MPADVLDAELSGLDHLEVTPRPGVGRRRRLWSLVWPKLVALAVVVGCWQLLVWSPWRPDSTFPGPVAVLARVADDVTTAALWEAVATTMRRAVVGFATAAVIGTAVGLAVTRWRAVRLGIGSVITGLQAMPSIVWFPLVLLVAGQGEAAIMLVVVLGAAPSIAGGVVAGIDQVPPQLRRVGITLGAGHAALYRDVVIPAAMPAMLMGLKQGWAFSWRGLMAGELLAGTSVASLGGRLQEARVAEDTVGLLAAMLVVLVIGIMVDTFGFRRAEAVVLRRRGLAPESTGR